MLPVSKRLSGICFLLSALAACIAAAQADEKVLYSFRGGNDGNGPGGTLFLGTDGNFYGTTETGGSGIGCNNGNAGCGTIFSLTPQKVEAVLHAFQGGSDGAYPETRLVVDGSGNLFGNTNAGGTFDYGTVFELTPGGSETALYSFTDGADGGVPEGDLAIDSSGNLYGVTGFGGDMSCFSGQGCGTVFQISQSGIETTLHAFEGGNDGIQPLGGVLRDGSGNLYGTTPAGGGSPNCTFGCGTVFKVASNGTETVLYAFQGINDGWGSRSPLIVDNADNLYGTAPGGGSGCSGGCGIVFKIAANGTESVLYSFKGGNDGNAPEGGLIMDKSGNLFGTTYAGGGTSCKGKGCGTVFKLAPDGTEKIVVSFDKGGRHPLASLLLKRDILYGTASQGGAHRDGVVFKVKN